MKLILVSSVLFAMRKSYLILFYGRRKGYAVVDLPYCQDRLWKRLSDLYLNSIRSAMLVSSLMDPFRGW
jgi:hypothetical protein